MTTRTNSRFARVMKPIKMGVAQTAGGVCVKPIDEKAVQEFWKSDPLMVALANNTAKWGDMLIQTTPLSTTITIPRVRMDAPLEELAFYQRLSNPFDDAWDTSRLSADECTQFYFWATANGWIVSDVTPEGCMAAPPLDVEMVEEANVSDVYRPSPEELEAAEKLRIKAENLARNAEIEARKAKLAAEGKPVNRAERRAAEKAAKEAAAAAAAQATATATA